jgi:hypothetical protein
MLVFANDQDLFGWRKDFHGIVPFLLLNPIRLNLALPLNLAARREHREMPLHGQHKPSLCRTAAYHLSLSSTTLILPHASLIALHAASSDWLHGVEAAGPAAAR